MGIYAPDNAPIWRPQWGAVSVPHPPIWGGGYGCAYPPIWGGVCALCTPFLPPLCHHSTPCNCAQAAPDGPPISTRRPHQTRAQAPQRRPQPAPKPRTKADSTTPMVRAYPRPSRTQARPYTQAACTPIAECPRPSAMTAPKAPQKPPKAPARPSQPRHPIPAPILPSALAMLAQAQTPANGTTSHSSTAFDYMPHNALRS